MKILWCGDAPTISTGFGKCTRFACAKLHTAGHSVHVLGINYAGDPHGYPYSVYPCINGFDGGHDAFGVSRLPRLIERLNPDLIVILQDPWNVADYFHSIDTYNMARVKGGTAPLTIPPITGWLAVDAKNQWGAVYLNRLDHVLVWTEFAKDELQKDGYSGPCSIVPLGVDLEQFKPGDRAEARSRLLAAGLWPKEIPLNRYIVGVVGRNQPRKRLDLVLEYFREWIDNDTAAASNAMLYMHVAPTGEKGANLQALTHYYGLGGKVILSQPDIGVGVDELLMADVYSSFDVYLSLSHAEGWNLCAHEAMACGVACICPDQGGFASWAKDGAILIPCTSSCLSAPLNDHPYTIGGIADRSLTVKALKECYRSAVTRRAVGAAGRDQAARFTWERSAKGLCSELESIMERLNVVREELPVAIAQ